jgi:CheY-like chemotaxis protein/anti-sigma regulatory factor (Ser/Thr protein kinase)
MTTSPSPAHAIKSSPGCPVLRERDERLESLKFLVGKMVHDFNNFLVPLLGYVGLLKEDLSATSNVAAYAEAMQSAAVKTEGYLDMMLMAVRPFRTFQPKPTDFQQVVASTVEGWKSGLPAGAEISVQQNLARCRLTLDQAQWEKVIVQLLNNVRYALVTGGSVQIDLEAQTLTSEEMLHLNIAVPDVFRFSVRDSGFGMSPSVLRRACEPFFTTRFGGAGVGLGLTLVHSVVHLHGGQVQIESVEDEGTMVTLWIPDSPARVVGSANATQRKAAVLKRPLVNGRSKILLIEPDVLTREVLKACLLETNHEVLLATGAEDALNVLRRFPQDWALIVSAEDLPGGSGFEVCKSWSAADPEIRAVIIGAALKSSDSESAAPGSTQFLLLRKPFGRKLFKEAVRSQLAANP